jgi:hypothetical protein
MKRTLLFLCAVPLLASFALASNPQDEQMVRNAYAKLAYAVQSKIVYAEAQKNQNLKASELTQKLQENELRFDITAMSSGALSEIASKPYTDFVTQPHGEDVLSIMHDTATFDEKGQRFTSLFAVPYWTRGPQSQADWSVPVKDALAGEQPTFSRPRRRDYEANEIADCRCFCGARAGGHKCDGPVYGELQLLERASGGGDRR